MDIVVEGEIKNVHIQAHKLDIQKILDDDRPKQHIKDAKEEDFHELELYSFGD
jgi:hypothetical protein